MGSLSKTHGHNHYEHKHSKLRAFSASPAEAAVCSISQARYASNFDSEENRELIRVPADTFDSLNESVQHYVNVK